MTTYTVRRARVQLYCATDAEGRIVPVRAGMLPALEGLAPHARRPIDGLEVLNVGECEGYAVVSPAGRVVEVHPAQGEWGARESAQRRAAADQLPSPGLVPGPRVTVYRYAVHKDSRTHMRTFLVLGLDIPPGS